MFNRRKKRKDETPDLLPSEMPRPKRSGFQGTKINPQRLHRSQIKFIVFLTIISAFMILPLIYIFSHAFKPVDELFAYPPRFFVEKPTLRNFRQLLQMAGLSEVPVSRYLFNSFLITIVTVFLNILVSTMAAYGFSKIRFRGKQRIFDVNTLALMFVPVAVTIPRYLIIVNMGLTNNFFAHILPSLAMPVGLFLVKQFIDQIPGSLVDAAQVDGANHWYIYRRIVLPLIKPAVATVAILAFQSSWNAVEPSNLYIEQEGLRNFAFYMSTLTAQTNTVAGQGVAAASALIMFLPNLIIFLFLQSNVMNTMAHSGIK